MDVDVHAYIVTFGELEGGRFNWDRFDWEKEP